MFPANSPFAGGHGDAIGNITTRGSGWAEWVSRAPPLPTAEKTPPPPDPPPEAAIPVARALYAPTQGYPHMGDERKKKTGRSIAPRLTLLADPGGIQGAAHTRQEGVVVLVHRTTPTPATGALDAACVSWRSEVKRTGWCAGHGCRPTQVRAQIGLLLSLNSFRAHFSGSAAPYTSPDCLARHSIDGC